jgi:hypothetical protein
MLKEAKTISYIQQSSHEWIHGNEEETTCVQATESLRVVPIDIQHGLEVLMHPKLFDGLTASPKVKTTKGEGVRCTPSPATLQG